MPLVQLSYRQLEAARKSQIILQRRAILNQFRGLRQDSPSPRLPRNLLNPNRLAPKSTPRTNPIRTRDLLFLLTRLRPPNPAKTPKRLTQKTAPLTLARFCTIVDLQLGYLQRGG